MILLQSKRIGWNVTTSALGAVHVYVKASALCAGHKYVVVALYNGPHGVQKLPF